MSVLKGNKSFYDYEVSDLLAYNVRRWLEYGLLEMGAYTRAEYALPTSGYTNLQRVYDDRYGGEGKVYEGFGPGWVWENNVSPITAIDPPLVASGVRVNNVFYPVGTSGTYEYSIDFQHGRVVFKNALPATARVSCEYTFRDVAVHVTDEPEWKTVIQQWTTNFDKLDTLSPSGMAQILKQNRVWLPSVFVDVGNRTNEPLQLGGGEINSFTVDYHIFSDKAFSNRRLADTLNNQYQTVLDLFDVNNLQFPYKYDGTVVSGALTYPEIANRNSAYFWDFGRIEATDGGPRDSETDVYRAEVSHTIAVDRHLITY